MKFLIDANLLYKLAIFFKSKDYDVIHTDDLPRKEKTTDEEIRTYAHIHQRVVISKDSDFLDSHLINGIPAKLVLVSTGNIVYKLLINLFEAHLEKMIILLQTYNLIELTNNEIIAHEN